MEEKSTKDFQTSRSFWYLAHLRPSDLGGQTRKCVREEWMSTTYTSLASAFFPSKVSAKVSEVSSDLSMTRVFTWGPPCKGLNMLYLNNTQKNQHMRITYVAFSGTKSHFV